MTFHGLSSHPLYGVWYDMLYRCENSKSKLFGYYGGRGITVCQEWHDIKTFIQWALENDWKPSLEIDRIDVNGNYTPSNCRFVDALTQIRNRRPNKRRINPTLPAGVSINGRGFNAQIQWANKTRYLGFHRSPEAAHETFLWAQKELRKSPKSLEKIRREAIQRAKTSREGASTTLVERVSL